MTRDEWRQIWIAVAICLAINVGIAFIPGLLWFVWAIQLVYLIPATVILLMTGRSFIVGALWIVGGATFILDIAFCGYSSHI